MEVTHRVRSVSDAAGPVTFFEFTTAMAFQYFADEEIDVAVIEVGMGGRFDATNVLDPLGVLITNVAFDHEQYLGHTLSSIAYEKAGIIKKGSSVILGPMPEAPRTVIEIFAGEQRALPYRWQTDFRLGHESGEEFSYHGAPLDFVRTPVSSPWPSPAVECRLRSSLTRNRGTQRFECSGIGHQTGACNR